MKSLLDKKNSYILRGVAILLIALHNFVHLSFWGFTSENEMEFSYENVARFSLALESWNHIVVEFISYLGWIGVPVFIFFTGYGMSLSLPKDKMVSVKRKDSIKRVYLKLLALMLPAILFYIGVDIIKGEVWPEILKRLSYLAMITNWAYPYLNLSPGVYWYFGLTFQFYLIWILFRQYLNGRNLIVLSALSLMGLLGVLNYASPEVISIYRHNFTGWFPVFAIGVYLGMNTSRKKFGLDSIWLELLLLVGLLGCIVIISKWVVTWLFLPIVALAWFLIVGMLLMRSYYLSSLFTWIGKLSACIFVCHPIARTIVLNVLHPVCPDLLVNVFAYLMLTMVITLFYDQLYNWFLIKFLPQKTR